MNYFLILLFFFIFDYNLSFQVTESYSISKYLNDSYHEFCDEKSNEKLNIKNDNYKYLKLNTTNILTLKGVINEKSVNRFLYDFNLKKNKNETYIFIDSPGGSVEDGYKIITEFKKYNMTCIIEKAYSMAFAILQVCDKRYLLPHGKIMQHQISLGIMNEFGKIKSYLDFIGQIEDELLDIQSKKIGISSDDLKNRSNNEWWLFGKNAVEENCADKIINVECTPQLTKATYIINDGMYDYVYSKCPLVPNYLEKIQNNKNNRDFIYFI